LAKDGKERLEWGWGIIISHLLSLLQKVHALLSGLGAGQNVASPSNLIQLGLFLAPRVGY